ncbi:hypothetical protein FQN54_001603 [Arachnomyces sp. PD_36]|nr:hypothetical protein FQN54_001603 [Arachnomyces sp. PD_36]
MAGDDRDESIVPAGELTAILYRMPSHLKSGVDPLLDFKDNSERYFSSLEKVPRGTLDVIRREAREQIRCECVGSSASSEDDAVLGSEKVHVLADGDDSVVLKRVDSRNVHYIYTVSINYGCDFDLQLNLTKHEAATIVSIRNLRPDLTEQSVTGIGSNEDFTEENFVEGIGDQTGFYFRFTKELTLLRVNKQMRQEALPLVYRLTHFEVTDIPCFVQFGISVGQIGRENINSLALTWEDGSDFRDRSGQPRLPCIHASRCVSLLKRFKALKFLTIYLDANYNRHRSLDELQADPGLFELSSVRGLQRAEILSSSNTPWRNAELADWLEPLMKSPREE